jgi:hypothetical protein
VDQGPLGRDEESLVEHSSRLGPTSRGDAPVRLVSRRLQLLRADDLLLARAHALGLTPFRLPAIVVPGPPRRPRTPGRPCRGPRPRPRDQLKRCPVGRRLHAGSDIPGSRLRASSTGLLGGIWVEIGRSPAHASDYPTPKGGEPSGAASSARSPTPRAAHHGRRPAAHRRREPLTSSRASTPAAARRHRTRAAHRRASCS